MPSFTDRPRVLTAAPDGTDIRWLGTLGFFSQLSYDFALPGVPGQLTGWLQRRVVSHPKAIDAGRIVQVYRGAKRMWDGKLDEAVAGDAGWQISAHGSGTFGDDFDAYYTGTFTADNPVNAAITRGMR